MGQGVRSPIACARPVMLDPQLPAFNVDSWRCPWSSYRVSKTSHVDATTAHWLLDEAREMASHMRLCHDQHADATPAYSAADRLKIGMLSSVVCAGTSLGDEEPPGSTDTSAALDVCPGQW